MGAEVFASPLSLLLAALVACASAVGYYSGTARRAIKLPRLVAGYGAVVLACVVISAASSYVSLEEALVKWKVGPESYSEALQNTFFTTLVLVACVSVIGVAVIGLPIIRFLEQRGRATTTWVLVASIAVSILVAFWMSGTGDRPPFRHVASTLVYVTTTHALLALAFCMGAGLPRRGPLAR